MDGQSYKTRADIAADIDVLEYRAEKLEAEAKQLRQQIAQLEQAAADLGNGNLSERHIERGAGNSTPPCGTPEGLAANGRNTWSLENEARQLDTAEGYERFPAVSGVSGANDYDSDPVAARMRDAYDHNRSLYSAGLGKIAEVGK